MTATSRNPWTHCLPCLCRKSRLGGTTAWRCPTQASCTRGEPAITAAWGTAPPKTVSHQRWLLHCSTRWSCTSTGDVNTQLLAQVRHCSVPPPRAHCFPFHVALVFHTDDGQVYAWGSGFPGPLVGANTGHAQSLSPTRVKLPVRSSGTAVVSVAAGDKSSFVITASLSDDHESVACVEVGVAQDSATNDAPAAVFDAAWLDTVPEFRCTADAGRHSLCFGQRVAMAVLADLGRLATAYLPPWFGHAVRAGPTAAPLSSCPAPFPALPAALCRPRADAAVVATEGAVTVHAVQRLVAEATLRSFYRHTRPFVVFPSRTALRELVTVVSVASADAAAAVGDPVVTAAHACNVLWASRVLIANLYVLCLVRPHGGAHLHTSDASVRASRPTPLASSPPRTPDDTPLLTWTDVLQHPAVATAGKPEVVAARQVLFEVAHGFRAKLLGAGASSSAGPRVTQWRTIVSAVCTQAERQAAHGLRLCFDVLFPTVASRWALLQWLLPLSPSPSADGAAPPHSFVSEMIMDRLSQDAAAAGLLSSVFSASPPPFSATIRWGSLRFVLFGRSPSASRPPS